MTPESGCIPSETSGLLLRRLLPELLECLGREGFATVIRAQDLPHSRWSASIDPAARSFVGILRATRAELAAEFQTEWIRAVEFGKPRSLQRLGGARKVRHDALPGLNEALEAASSTGVGQLLRACVELAINIAITRNDNDRRPEPGPVPASVIGAYRAAIAPGRLSSDRL